MYDVKYQDILKSWRNTKRTSSMIDISLTNKGRNTYDDRNNDDETNIVLGFIKKKKTWGDGVKPCFSTVVLIRDSEEVFLEM